MVSFKHSFSWVKTAVSMLWCCLMRHQNQRSQASDQQQHGSLENCNQSIWRYLMCLGYILYIMGRCMVHVKWVNACQYGIAWMYTKYRMYNPNLQHIPHHDIPWHHDIIALSAFLRITWHLTIFGWPLAMALAPLLRSAAVLDLCEVGPVDSSGWILDETMQIWGDIDVLYVTVCNRSGVFCVGDLFQKASRCALDLIIPGILPSEERMGKDL